MPAAREAQEAQPRPQSAVADLRDDPSGQFPAPAAFDRSLTNPDVLAALRPYGV